MLFFFFAASRAEKPISATLYHTRKMIDPKISWDCIKPFPGPEGVPYVVLFHPSGAKYTPKQAPVPRPSPARTPGVLAFAAARSSRAKAGAGGELIFNKPRPSRCRWRTPCRTPGTCRWCRTAPAACSGWTRRPSPSWPARIPESRTTWCGRNRPDPRPWP